MCTWLAANPCPHYPADRESETTHLGPGTHVSVQDAPADVQIAIHQMKRADPRWRSAPDIPSLRAGNGARIALMNAIKEQRFGHFPEAAVHRHPDQERAIGAVI